MTEHDAVIVDALRTPIGTAGGAFKNVDAASLLAPVLSALKNRYPVALEHIVMGNIRGPGGNPARVAALQAGIGEHVPALSVDMECGSGLAAVELGIRMVLGGEPGFVLAGGTQSVSTQPLTFWPGTDGRDPVEFTKSPFTDPNHDDPEMGVAADLVAAEHGITRERADAYAVRSFERAMASIAAGAFDREIVPIAGLSKDERPRSGFTTARLGRFRPAFTPDGITTAANSCGVNDGAAAALICDGATAREHGYGGLRVIDVVSAGANPDRPGVGAVAAVRRLFERTGCSAGQLEYIDINEAFAGQVLACLDELGIDEHRNCPTGGAIALGHPWAATGAVQIARAFTALREPGERALIAIAIGGGQGTALLVERMPDSG